MDPGNEIASKCCPDPRAGFSTLPESVLPDVRGGRARDSPTKIRQREISRDDVAPEIAVDPKLV